MKLPKKIRGAPVPVVMFLVLTLAYLWFFGRATQVVRMEKQTAAKNPELAKIPVPMADTSISPVQGTTLSYFGYDFEAPWDIGVRKTVGSIAAIGSKSEQQAMSFVDPAHEVGFVETMKVALGTRFGELAPFYGENNLRSDYDLARATLNASPSELSYIFPRGKAVRTAVFLMIKETEITGAETGLYSFKIGRLRGFQNGDPARARNVHVKAFDSEDHEFEFFFGSKSGPNAGVTQAEINRVLQTLRPVVTTQ